MPKRGKIVGITFFDSYLSKTKKNDYEPQRNKFKGSEKKL